MRRDQKQSNIDYSFGKKKIQTYVNAQGQKI